MVFYFRFGYGAGRNKPSDRLVVYKFFTLPFAGLCDRTITVLSEFLSYTVCCPIHIRQFKIAIFSLTRLLEARNFSLRQLIYFSLILKGLGFCLLTVVQFYFVRSCLVTQYTHS